MAVTARFTVPGILTSTQTGGAPPLPDTTGLIFGWSLNGLTASYQDSGNLLTVSGDTQQVNIPSTANAPYPLTWATVGTAGANPLLITWYDQSGNPNDLDGTGHAPSLDDVNYQVTFNGTDQYMTTSAIDLSAVNKLTLHYWFKVPDLTNKPLAQFYGLFSEYLLSFGIEITDEANIFVGQTSSNGLNRKYHSFDTSYHLVSLVIDNTLSGASQVTGYYDGLSSDWATETANTNSEAFGSHPFYLGYDSDSPTYGAHSSKHCLLFNYAQTGAEVLAWYDYLASIS